MPEIRKRLNSRRLTAPQTALVAGVALLLYAVLTALQAGRHLWHDELYTYYIAAAPSLRQLWKDLPLDLNPPLEYLAVRASVALLGTGEYAVRLPSILSFLGASLCLGWFVARALRVPEYGILAVLVFWASPFFPFATEARPYALAAAFLSLALLAWQTTGAPRRRAWSVWLLAGAVCGMMLSHMLAGLYLVPLCSGEAVRAWRQRRIDRPVWAALILPCAIPFIFLGLAARVADSAFPFAFQASLLRIPKSYYGTLKLEALPLLAALGLALLVARLVTEDAPARTHLFGAEDWAVMMGLLLTPVVANLALMRLHSAYFDRYAIPVAFGYALGFTYFVASRTGGRRWPALAACLMLGLFFTAYNLQPGLRKSVWSKRSGDMTRADQIRLDQIRPELPLVAASGLTFVELDHYGDAPTIKRLFYLTGRDLAVGYAHATIFEGLPDAKQAFPIRATVMPYSAFVAEHSQFLVLGTPEYPEDWLLRSLSDSRAIVRYLGFWPAPYKDHNVYLVSIRGT